MHCAASAVLYSVFSEERTLKLQDVPCLREEIPTVSLRVRAPNNILYNSLGYLVHPLVVSW